MRIAWFRLRDSELYDWNAIRAADIDMNRMACRVWNVDHHGHAPSLRRLASFRLSDAPSLCPLPWLTPPPLPRSDAVEAAAAAAAAGSREESGPLDSQASTMTGSVLDFESPDQLVSTRRRLLDGNGLRVRQGVTTEGWIAEG